MRNYPSQLVSRLNRANSSYCSPETLRFFNAFGGEVLHTDQNTIIMVESIRDVGGFSYPPQPREYRVTRFHFSDDGSSVDVDRLTDNYPSARQAIKAYRDTV